MIYKILILAATLMATASHQCDCSGKFSSSNNSPTSSMSDPSSSSSSSADSSSSGGYQSCGCDCSSGSSGQRGGGRAGGRGHKHSSSGSDSDDSDGCYGAWGRPRCGGWGLPWLVVGPGSPGGFHGLHHGGRRHPYPGGLQGGQLLWCHPAAGAPGQLSPGFGSSPVGWGQPACGGAMLQFS